VSPQIRLRENLTHLAPVSRFLNVRRKFRRKPHSRNLSTAGAGERYLHFANSTQPIKMAGAPVCCPRCAELSASVDTFQAVQADA
jgi:hypothetical protein